MNAAGLPIFSAAYLMPAGSGEWADRSKHRSFLRLLIRMMEDEVPKQLVQMKKMREAFTLLRGYPMIGDFLAFQYIIDLNYSNIVNYSEMEFVMPGPGAKSGLRKCFSSFGGLSDMDIIQLVTKRQEAKFAEREIAFKALWGRRLQLIDCQNLFCEIDKYPRVAFPEYAGVGNRTRIKRLFQPAIEPINYWFPPKWGINELIAQRRSGQRKTGI